MGPLVFIALSKHPNARNQIKPDLGSGLGGVLFGQRVGNDRNALSNDSRGRVAKDLFDLVRGVYVKDGNDFSIVVKNRFNDEIAYNFVFDLKNKCTKLETVTVV